MSATNNFKRKTFGGQNSSATPSSSTQFKKPKRYDFYKYSLNHKKNFLGQMKMTRKIL